MHTSSVQTANATIDLGWHLFLAFAFVVAASFIPADAFASGFAIDNVLCNIVGLFTGKTGRAIATVAVIAVGVGALLGKLSWGMALIIAIGIALIFGAASIVNTLGNSAGNSTSGC